MQYAVHANQTKIDFQLDWKNKQNQFVCGDISKQIAKFEEKIKMKKTIDLIEIRRWPKQHTASVHFARQAAKTIAISLGRWLCDCIWQTEY